MNKTTSRGPGRPMAKISLPRGKFSFADLCDENDHVTPLTLRKFLKRDAVRQSRSEVVLVKGEMGEPTAKRKANSGLGRKTFVYIRRAVRKAASNLKAARKSTVTIPLNTPPQTPALTPTPIVASAP